MQARGAILAFMAAMRRTKWSFQTWGLLALAASAVNLGALAPQTPARRSPPSRKAPAPTPAAPKAPAAEPAPRWNYSSAQWISGADFLGGLHSIKLRTRVTADSSGQSPSDEETRTLLTNVLGARGIATESDAEVAADVVVSHLYNGSGPSALHELSIILQFKLKTPVLQSGSFGVIEVTPFGSWQFEAWRGNGSSSDANANLRSILKQDIETLLDRLAAAEQPPDPAWLASGWTPAYNTAVSRQFSSAWDRRLEPAALADTQLFGPRQAPTVIVTLLDDAKNFLDAGEVTQRWKDAFAAEHLTSGDPPRMWVHHELYAHPGNAAQPFDYVFEIARLFAPDVVFVFNDRLVRHEASLHWVASNKYSVAVRQDLSDIVQKRIDTFVPGYMEGF
jgi:hypothetical protein